MFFVVSDHPAPPWPRLASQPCGCTTPSALGCCTLPIRAPLHGVQQAAAAAWRAIGRCRPRGPRHVRRGAACRVRRATSVPPAVLTGQASTPRASPTAAAPPWLFTFKSPRLKMMLITKLTLVCNLHPLNVLTRFIQIALVSCRRTLRSSDNVFHVTCFFIYS